MSLKMNESQLIEFAKAVELTATRFLEGSHASPRGGEGLEFHSYSPYGEGEDSRRIDWRRWAQSERLYVKRFEKEEKLSWRLWLDRSSSMNYALKKDSASLWTGVLAYLANLWTDQCTIYPESNLSLQEVYSKLASGELGSDPLQLGQMEGAAKSKLVLISDFLFDLSLLEKAKENVWPEFASVHLIQLLDPSESQFNLSDVIEFEDMESDDRMLLDASAVRKEYLAQLKFHQDSLRSLVGEKGSFHCFEARVDGLADQLNDFFEGL
jgi:hypothetical protein